MNKKTISRRLAGRSGRPAYAYVALVAGALGTIMTLPGQTNGISPFLDYLIDALPLNRVWVSSSYMIGTATSALVLGVAGRAYDRFGSRVVGPVAAFGLGLGVAGLTQIESVTALANGIVGFAGEQLIALLILAAGFFCIRFFGQGVLTMVSRNMIMTWFNDRRGPASAVLGISMALAAAVGPSLFNIVINRIGWQATWLVLAAVVAGFGVLAIIFFRDNRAAVQTSESGVNEPQQAEFPPAIRNRVPRRLQFLATSEPLHPEVDFTAREAKRTAVLWVYSLSLGLASLVGTGFAFHVVDIMAEVGLSRAAALAVFIPASIISVVLQMGANIASDYMRLKFYVALQSLGIISISAAISVPSPIAAYALATIGMALATGLNGVISTISWPRYFGLKNLGAISGFGFSWIVGGSALGPFAFSFFESVTGSYRLASLIFILLAAGVGLAALYTVHPRRPGNPGIRPKKRL